MERPPWLLLRFLRPRRPFPWVPQRRCGVSGVGGFGSDEELEVEAERVGDEHFDEALAGKVRFCDSLEVVLGYVG